MCDACGMEDRLDRELADWARVRPELDFSPIAVAARVRRVRAYLDQELERTYEEFGLSVPSFQVLAALRRRERPYQVTQRALMEELGLTSGTVSVRIDRLVDAGLVVRGPDPYDRRSTLVTLTEHGESLFDACAPAALAHEERLLSALSDEDRAMLADLLRRLLVSFEHPALPDDPAATLGVTLAPAHLARQMRRDVGLPDRTGLLVRAVRKGGPAALAGVRRGDLLVSVGTQELRSLSSLSRAMSDADASVRLRVVRGLDERDVEVPIPAASRRAGNSASRRRRRAGGSRGGAPQAA